MRPRAIAIGSSTGGPQALFKVLGDLGQQDLPIFLTQHMPATFTSILAQHIAKQCRLDCREAVDGEAVGPGRIYLAPGDYHMRLKRRGSGLAIALGQDAPVNFCRPAVDPMLESLVEAYGGAVLAVILTGMGHDGRAGCETLVNAGGGVIAQDEATSVVWGMPGAVAQAGLCFAVTPVAEVGARIRSQLGR